MLRAASIVVAAVLGGAGAWPQEIFRATTDVVSVDVSVKSGRKPIVGLTSADFTLLDNGVPQQIDALSLETLPIDVTLVLDVSGSTRGTMLVRLKTAVRDTAALLTPRDRLRLVSISNLVREVFDFLPGGTVPNLTALSASGGTSLYDGLVAAMMKVRPAERRHLIIAFTDGEDTASFLDLAGARDVALRSDGVLHVVLARVSMGLGVFGPGREDIALLTASTGGAVTEFNVNGIAPIGNEFTRVIDDFRTSYVLRYTVAGVKREGWHDLTVTVNKPGTYAVRARKGYSGR